jgi:hypothetical protein
MTGTIEISRRHGPAGKAARAGGFAAMGVIAGGGLHLVFQRTGAHMVLTRHQSLIPVARNIRRIVFFGLPDLCVFHPIAVKEIRFCRAGHQNGDCDSRIFLVFSGARFRA